jgi:transglutaminase-like putative cysteine protease
MPIKWLNLTMPLKIKRNCRSCHALIGLLIWLIGSGLGCSRLTEVKSIEPVPGLRPWNADVYADYVAQNMKELNRRYTGQYEPVEFVVDTAAGSARVQSLIDPAATALLAEVIADPASSSAETIEAITEVILLRFEYIPEPEPWAPVRDTIRSEKGDCKNLSLVLMSALAASGIDAYAAVSNGHMWVQAYDGQRWRILETDTDPGRNRIYRIPGFYENPLYKIFLDRSLKRIPR